jgi:hypothetical protein
LVQIYVDALVVLLAHYDATYTNLAKTPRALPKPVVSTPPPDAFPGSFVTVESIANFTFGKRSKKATENAAQDIILAAIKKHIHRDVVAKLIPTQKVALPGAIVKVMAKAGMQVLDSEDKKVRNAIKQLCAKVGIPVTPVILRECLHFGAYDAKSKLAVVISIRVYRLNNNPKSVAVSIDVAVSTVPGVMSNVVYTLQAYLRTLKGLCVMFAQVACPAHARPSERPK